jgi:hypothetical protein
VKLAVIVLAAFALTAGPAAAGPLGSCSTTNGCAVSAGPATVYADRCDESGTSSGTSQSTCRTGANDAVYRCDKTTADNGGQYPSGSVRSHCGLHDGVAGGALGYTCDIDEAYSWSDGADESYSCTTRVGPGATGATHTCTENDRFYGAPGGHSEACVSDVHVAGQTVLSCTTSPVVDPRVQADPAHLDPTATPDSPPSAPSCTP